MIMDSNYDVIVLGGGFAGSAAALASAREGMKTLLIEQAGYLGGAPINCLVSPFMNYSTFITNENGERYLQDLSRGLFETMVERMKAMDAFKGRFFHEEYLKLVLDQMMQEYGVDVLFHATLCDVDVSDEHLNSLTVITKGGKLTYTAKQYIDCSGDADLAVMAGCPWHLGRDKDHLCQPMTLCFRVANVDTDLFFSPESTHKMQEIYKRWQAEGKTSNPREDVLVFKNLVNGVVHFNTTRVVKKNPVDAIDVSWAEMEARKQAFELFTMMKQELEAFKDAQFLMSAAWVGARESRMIDGEHLLTEQELKACTRFPDAIAAGNYDIDIHNPEGSGTSHYYFPEGQYYTLPFRSLIPKKINNLLVAGRCISSTHEAQASYRIMPIVCTLGEAAGVGAAVAAKSGVSPKDADIKEIQRILVENGAFIG